MKHTNTTLRRGNTIVLVSAILVLLVIVATAYVTRTQSDRTTAQAIQRTQTRESDGREIGSLMAAEVVQGLFPEPIDSSDPAVVAGRVADSNYPRLPSVLNGDLDSDGVRHPERYGVDADFVDNLTFAPGADGLPDFPYNFAPYHVVPYTNWPDIRLVPGQPFSNPFLLPRGPGNPGSYDNVHVLLLGEGNPLGNPGFGDTRWLCDTEPLRWTTGSMNAPQYLDAFSHWRHLSYIGRPNNGWRICTDIADVFDFADGDGMGLLVTDLTVPVEQWLTVRPTEDGTPIQWSRSGDTNLSNSPINEGMVGITLYQRYREWFFKYANSYTNPDVIPPNFLHLNDLNADGFYHNFADRPEDEFIFGTPRHTVSRILADADGDGYTDSFWWLAPTTVDSGIRQLVAVRIVDDSARANINTASRFHPGFVQSNAVFPGASGETPADVALVGQNVFNDPSALNASANTGILDNPANDEGARIFHPFPGQYPGLYDGTNDGGNTYAGWEPNAWPNFLVERGITNWTGSDSSFDPFVDDPDNDLRRRQYWLFSGLNPGVPQFGLRPLELSSELELKMFHGQNHPWILSPLERVLQTVNVNQGGRQILHANIAREESSEFLDQLRNRELLYTMRRHLTTFNGARNDEMPPWLRWRWTAPQVVQPYTGAAVDNFFSQSGFKLDLREPNPSSFIYTTVGLLKFHERLPGSLAMALTDGPAQIRRFDSIPSYKFNSYYGPFDASDYDDPDGNLAKTRRLAASFAANILAARDPDTFAPLSQAIPLPEIGGNAENYGQLPADPSVRYLGMERQPFLTEVFIAHVYANNGTIVLPGFQFPEEGQKVITDIMEHRTIAVVQIANPFDEEIDLAAGRYKIRVAGGDVDLTGVLQPATEHRPTTAVIHSIPDSFESQVTFGASWRDFLDLQSFYMADGTLILGPNELPTMNWPVVRTTYDTIGSQRHVVELIRQDPETGEDVVIDRVDQTPGDELGPQLRDILSDLAEPPPPLVDVPNMVFNGIRIGDDDYMVLWARATRDWGREFQEDLDGPGAGTWFGTQPHERAPRYILGWQYAHTSKNSMPGQPTSAIGDSYDSLLDDPDLYFQHAHEDNGYFKVFGKQMPWKPTLFNVNPQHDKASGDPMLPDAEPPPLLERFNATYANRLYGQSMASDGIFRTGCPRKGYDADASGDAELYEHSLQMLQKDGNFQQVGELLNVWLWGHELKFIEVTPGEFAFDELGEGTIRTFSEHICDRDLVGFFDEGINRLRMKPTGNDGIGFVLGGVNTQTEPWADPAGDPIEHVQFTRDYRRAMPALPAGQRVLDLFVCDGVGWNVSNPDPYRLANGFSGRITPGLINVNTAPVEVLRALPHWYKLIKRPIDGEPAPNYAFYPRVALPEGLVSYRERFGTNDTGIEASLIGGPDYVARDEVLVDNRLRQDRGIASTSELMLLTESAQNQYGEPTGATVFGEGWNIHAAATRNTFPGALNDLSTDVNQVRKLNGNLEPDRTMGDHEERNLLFSGVSNLVSTRSDVFTVYFRIRSFRRNPVTGIWNALDPEQILDDSRYVMGVDRSQVEHPDDRPRILYLEKMPK